MLTCQPSRRKEWHGSPREGEALSIDQSISVSELLAAHPQVVPVLERFGIGPDDGETVALAAWEDHVPLGLLLATLEESIAAPGGRGQTVSDWSQADAEELIDYLKTQHHAYLRRELPRLEDLLARAIATGSGHGTALDALQPVLVSFKKAIEEHLAVEEEILFPRVRAAENNVAGAYVVSAAGEISVDAIAMTQMKSEHSLVEAATEEIRALTGNFELSEDACPDLAALYEGLGGLVVKLREHVDLEDAFLWPAEVAQEAKENTCAVEDIDDIVDTSLDVCPRTGEPCPQGSYAQCSCFWRCVADAVGGVARGDAD